MKQGQHPAVAMADMDGLKALNNYGYDVGNALLLAMAVVLRQVGLVAFHDKGDEFLCRGFETENLRSKLESARSLLRDHAVVIQRADGSTLNVAGADFSYGVGEDLDQAELALRKHKTERERTGNISRGELRSITVSFAKEGLTCTAAGLARGRIHIQNRANSFPRITSVILSQPKSVKSSSTRCNSP
jgi:GGDEF domain-containing protein